MVAMLTSFVFFVGFLLLEQIEVIVVGGYQLFISLISFHPLPKKGLFAVFGHEKITSKATEI